MKESDKMKFAKEILWVLLIARVFEKIEEKILVLGNSRLLFFFFFFFFGPRGRGRLHLLWGEGHGSFAPWESNTLPYDEGALQLRHLCLMPSELGLVCDYFWY